MIYLFIQVIHCGFFFIMMRAKFHDRLINIVVVVITSRKAKKKNQQMIKQKLIALNLRA